MIDTLERTKRAELNSARRVPTFRTSELARRKLLSWRGDPLFYADWMRVLMIHLALPVAPLQEVVPFELDRFEGQAYVTLVAFSMENMRPRFGGRLGALLFKPIATHDFLNVRTYVRHRGQVGIHFLAEWLSSRLAVKLGPPTFSLPYRHGQIEYRHHLAGGSATGSVSDVRSGNQFSYQTQLDNSLPLAPCREGSLEEWLMERYTAFNSAGVGRRMFWVWHPPWPQCEAAVQRIDLSLLEANWDCFRKAKLAGANYCPGLKQVWMSRPYFC